MSARKIQAVSARIELRQEATDRLIAKLGWDGDQIADQSLELAVYGDTTMVTARLVGSLDTKDVQELLGVAW